MESWAEKYRPESLSDIIGNTKVINDLKKLLKINFPTKPPFPLADSQKELL